APVAGRHRARAGAHRPGGNRRRQGGGARAGARRGRRRRLRALPRAETPPVRRRLRGGRDPGPALDPLPPDGHPRRGRRRPAVGADVAGRQARDEDAAGRAGGAPDGALGRGAARAPGYLPRAPQRAGSPHPDSGGWALDLGLRRLLRRPLFRPPPPFPQAQPQKDPGREHRRPRSHGDRDLAVRLRLPGVHARQGAGDRGGRLPREPDGRPLRVRPKAHPRREGPRPLSPRPRRPARQDRQPALHGPRGILHPVARM
ncbi:MAG: Phosphatidate cytidylyltransferase, partial [uncultured Rubrobacteraceae bacterium]